MLFRFVTTVCSAVTLWFPLDEAMISLGKVVGRCRNLVLIRVSALLSVVVLTPLVPAMIIRNGIVEWLSRARTLRLIGPMLRCVLTSVKVWCSAGWFVRQCPSSVRYWVIIVIGVRVQLQLGRLIRQSRLVRVKQPTLRAWLGAPEVCVTFPCLASVPTRSDPLMPDCLVKYILGWLVGGRVLTSIMFPMKLMGFVNSSWLCLVVLLFGLGVGGKVIPMTAFL